MFSVDKIIALRDNYVYFLKDNETGDVVIVDPGEPQVVLEYCLRHQLQPKFILNTHHHWDHVNGNRDIKKALGVKIVGYVGDAYRIPDIDITLDEGDVFRWGSSALSVMYVPGHTTGHIAYYSEADHSLFCGDTMFSMGCGGNFEGTYEQLYQSLLRLKALPEETLVYCGHEYTVHGWRFACRVEGLTEALRARGDEVRSGKTVPSSIGIERATNPYIRCDSMLIREKLGLSHGATDFEVFCALRG